MPLEVMQVPLIQEATNELIEETNEEIGNNKKKELRANKQL